LRPEAGEKKAMKGRGTDAAPPNRFERMHVELEYDDDHPPPEKVATVYYRDASRTILAENQSPDVPFRWSLNPYRGCEHGCSYCYARPSHEQLGFNAGIDFESRIMVKPDAPALLRKTFSSPCWTPEFVSLSGNTDCYQPVERTLRITRGCVEVFAEFRNPVGIITKSALVARDVDLLRELARHGAVHVFSSITSLDPDLAARLEPRAARPHRRLEAVAGLAAAGIPVAVMIGPVIPGLNDEEIPDILRAARAAGALGAAWVLLRLAPPLDALFERWLGEHFPEKRSRVLHRIRDTRGGAISDSRWGVRQRGQGPYAEQIAALFRAAAHKYGLDRPLPALRTDAFRRPPQPGDQMRLL
jgi:DNA repair photolyase